MVVVYDENNKFRMANVGDSGSSNVSIFYFFIFSCNLGEAITNNTLNLHKSEPAWSSGINFTHLIVVDVVEDETSPLRADLMKPFPQEVLQL